MICIRNKSYLAKRGKRKKYVPYKNKGVSNSDFVQKKKPNPIRKKFPEEFPFWSRLKISKNRPTLVIDEDYAWDNVKNRYVDGFVHREVIHVDENDIKKQKKYELVRPNPDKDDKQDMYLKKPTSLPMILFKPIPQSFDMPKKFIEKYSKNNRKKKK